MLRLVQLLNFVSLGKRLLICQPTTQN